MKQAAKVIDDFAMGIIAQREREGLGNITAGDKKKEVASRDLLSLYMALRDENGQPMSRKQLRDAVLNLVIVRSSFTIECD